MRAILPESFAWGDSIRWLGESGRFDEARAALAFGRRLGLSGKGADTVPLEASQTWIELAALEPKAARELAVRLGGDPRISVSTMGAAYVAASYWMEGRVVDAEAALLHEMERQRAVGTPFGVASAAFNVLRARRLSGRPAADAELVAVVEKHAASVEATDPNACTLVTEAALARAAAAPKEAKKILAAAEERCEARAAREHERFLRDSGRLAALPLVRAARGDAAAAALWMASSHASFSMRRFVALDAALALEAAGKPAEAAAAYRLAMDPRNLDDHALAAMIARVRLAPLLRAAGRADEAAKLDAAVDRLWQKADPGLRDAVRATKPAGATPGALPAPPATPTPP